MQRKTVRDFDPAVLRLFDQYVHGLIDRRAFFAGASKYVSGGTAAMLFEALNPRFAEARRVAENDPRLATRRIEVASPDGNGTLRACSRCRPRTRASCSACWWCTRTAA